MRKTELLSIARSLLPPNTPWPGHDVRLEGGQTVLMLVAKVSDPHVAVKLIDFVCPMTENFWARDDHRRHVIMDACHYGVHVSVLLRLIKWARKTSVRVIVPMSRQDVDGLDAVELAIQGGHGELVCLLLEQHGPGSHDDLLCKHYPIKVLELAIEAGNEQCVKTILSNKRVLHHLQPGATVRLNLNMRWEQRRDPVKRLFNIFTCVGAAIRCEMPNIVQLIYQVNTVETRHAVWYELYRASGRQEIPPVIKKMAVMHRLGKLWPQIRVIVMLRNWDVEKKKLTAWARIARLCRSHHDWDALTKLPWKRLPEELLAHVLGLLVPSKATEAANTALLIDYRVG
ncbi:hypothetical protein DVH05_017747 [Phytophthora capsici]|nr:hypothetical protein DVH05_017747 [Phytophthora capsici]